VSFELGVVRLRYDFWIIVGFAPVAFIAGVSILAWSEITSVATVAGAVSGPVGTVVGALFDDPFRSASRGRRRPPGIARDGRGGPGHATVRARRSVAV
jgi:hypothetical protein